MSNRLEITSTTLDTRAQVKKRQIQSMGFGRKIEEVYLVDVYTIDKKFSAKHLETIADALTNPVNQKSTFTSYFAPKNFTYAIEIGFLPGVTDNVGNTVQEIISDLLKTKFDENEKVYSSQVLYITCSISEKDAHHIGDSLANSLIQRIHLKTFTQFKKNRGMGHFVPKVQLENKLTVDEVSLNIADEELQKIGKVGVPNSDGTHRGPLALDLLYMKTIQRYFKNVGRNPTDIELESIAQTWSEHCKHTIFADPIDEVKDGLYKTFIKAATEKIRKKKGKKDFCVSVFTDNSGAIEFDKDYLVTHKAETHNSPSALDPFGGAITGIVGVNRDAIGFGLGAKPIANTYGFCFGDPRSDTILYKGPNFSQKMLSSERIMKGVIDGVNSGGNCSGIPTPQGFVMFDKRFQGKPLVFVGTIGFIPKKINGKFSYKKRARAGDYIVMIGGRVGQDGIHGATFSSEALSTGSPATAVQIGDPITQKKLSDAVVKEARNLNLFNSITDNGAGGLSCSVAEMAKECGGFEVDLNNVPVKYPGLQPWQIWISESQERMTLAVPKMKWKKFHELMQKRGVEATVIGTFTTKRQCVVLHRNKKIMDIGMEFLHNGLPPRPMKTTYTQPRHIEPNISLNKDITPLFLAMLQRTNIASFQFISRQYDHEVQATSVIKPLQGKGLVNTESTVLRPSLNSHKGVALSQGIYPTYSDIDTYHMASCAIDTAIRNLVAVGANPEKIALLDNFCWCSATEPERLGQLKRAVKACYDTALAFETPFISGKDSMFNDFKGYDEKGNPIKISIPPTLLISSISVLDDVTKCITIDTKFPGDLIYLLGETYDELGASEYYAMMGEEKTGKPYIGNTVPKVNPQNNSKLYRRFYQAVEKNLIASAISITRGGLAVALAKMSMAGMQGIKISITDPEKTLFSETQGRIMVTINPKNKSKFEQLMKGSELSHLGVVTSNQDIIIANQTGKIVNTTVHDVLQAYRSTFQNY